VTAIGSVDLRGGDSGTQSVPGIIAGLSAERRDVIEIFRRHDSLHEPSTAQPEKGNGFRHDRKR